MAYENYYFVSWANGTPISGDRLAQMSINIDQVKEASNDTAKGVISYYSAATQLPNATGWADFTEHELIYLRNEQDFNPAIAIDNRVSISAGRYYKISFDMAPITITGAGAEDSYFTLTLYRGTDLANTPLSLKKWNITPHTYSYINVAAAAANIANEALKTTQYTRIGAGTYSSVFTTATALTNQSYFITIKRTVGASANRATNYFIDSVSSSQLEFWVEDLGSL